MKRKLNKILMKNVNRANLGISLFAIFVGFSIVHLAAGSAEFQVKHVEDAGLTRSAARLADAFEQYNQKRFANK